MILYHNNRCSKSREALAFLQERGVEVTVINYLDKPLNEIQLRELAVKLDIDSPRAMMRCRETIYTELALEHASDDELFAALVRYPILLERPILVNGNRAAIGRPLAALQAVLD